MREGAAPHIDSLYDLFLPNAVIVKALNGTPECFQVREFVEPRRELLSAGRFADFAEWEISHQTRVFEHVAQRFSAYRKKWTEDGELRGGSGTKAFTFVLSAGAWRIASLSWDDGELNSGQYAIDHVQLAMPHGEEERARAFYARVLGFDEIEKPEHLRARGGLWLKAGCANVHLGVDAAFVPAKKAHPALRCGDYDALIARLRHANVKVVDDGDLFQGRPRCYVEDPFGNRLELIRG